MFRLCSYLSGFPCLFVYFVWLFWSSMYRGRFLVVFHTLLFVAVGIGSFTQDYRPVTGVVGPVMFFMFIVAPVLSAAQTLRVLWNMADGYGWYVVPAQVAKAWPDVLATPALQMLPWSSATKDRSEHSVTTVVAQYGNVRVLLLAILDLVDGDESDERDRYGVVWFLLPDRIVAPLIERTLLAIGAEAIGAPLVVKAMLVGDVSAPERVPDELRQHGFDVRDEPGERSDGTGSVTWLRRWAITVEHASIHAYSGLVNTSHPHAVLSLEYARSMLPRRSREQQRRLRQIIQLLTNAGWRPVETTSSSNASQRQEGRDDATNDGK
jgi:hypothetical protein